MEWKCEKEGNYQITSLPDLTNRNTGFKFEFQMGHNIWDVLTLKNYSLHFWNSNLTRHLVFYLAILPEDLSIQDNFLAEVIERCLHRRNGLRMPLKQEWI